MDVENMDVEKMDCVVKIEISGLILRPIYEDCCKDFGIEPRKNRDHWFDFYGEYDLIQEFIFHLLDWRIDFWIEFDGNLIYEYGKEGVNKDSERCTTEPRIWFA